jgi:outer membrane immunogenic protein
MRALARSIIGFGMLFCAASAVAADLPVKARPMPVAPGWTGFYIGVQAGGALADRTVSYVGDRASAPLFTAVLPGQQPVSPHGYHASGVTGGLEAGYNWQLSPKWLLGLEADFSGGGPKGSGAVTSILVSIPPITVLQTVTSDQRVDWWGTVRGRFGALVTPDLLLFGSAGFAYGHVSSSNRYGFAASVPVFLNLGFDGSTSFSCTENTTCFAGSGSTVKTGWTAGGGGEWRFARHWAFKAEYLYVDLGRDRVRSAATTLGTGFVGTSLSSYIADFGRTDFHVVRAGVNYQF